MNINAILLMCNLTINSLHCGLQARNYDLIGWSNHRPKEITAIVQAEQLSRVENDIGNAVQYMRHQFRIKHD